MISVSGRKWEEEKISKRLIEKIEQEYNFSKIVSKLIISRKFNKEEIYSINNNLKLSNFFKNNPDFIKSVNLVEKSIENIKSQDCLILLTDHDIFDYKIIEKHSKLIIDTRGRFYSSGKTKRFTRGFYFS